MYDVFILISFLVLIKSTDPCKDYRREMVECCNIPWKYTDTVLVCIVPLVSESDFGILQSLDICLDIYEGSCKTKSEAGHKSSMHKDIDKIPLHFNEW